MQHWTLRSARTTAATAFAVAAMIGLAGCAITSPQLVEQYDAADGISGTLTNETNGSEVRLLNVLVVRDTKTPRGSLQGTLQNTGTSAATVLLSASGAPSAAPAKIVIPAKGVVKLGDKDSLVVFRNTPSAGRLMNLSAFSGASGKIEMAVPVLAPTEYYATLTPPPVATLPAEAEPEASPSETTTAN